MDALYRRRGAQRVAASLVQTGWRIEGATFRRRGKGHERRGRWVSLKRKGEAFVSFGRGDGDWLSDGKWGGDR